MKHPNPGLRKPGSPSIIKEAQKSESIASDMEAGRHPLGYIDLSRVLKQIAATLRKKANELE